MRSSAIRLTLGAAAWIGFGVAAFLLFQSEKHIMTRAASVRLFDQHAHDASDALADLRASQQAYVAAGQGVGFWVPKVAATTVTVTALLESLRRSADGGARTALDQATATVAEFSNVDQRARDYLKSGQPLMAADVIFTEGGDAAATAARQVETARLAEHQAADVAEAAIRRQQAQALGAAAGLAAIVVLLLVPRPRPRETKVESTAEVATPTPVTAPAPAHATTPARFGFVTGMEAGGPVLRAAADLATDFGRVRDLDELTRLLGRAADVMDATGLMVWIGTTTGADLRPMLAHGYSSQMIARMPPVPRSGDNAAAAAYRSGTLQIVLSRPGGVRGAVVAPILSAEGCVGALSAEIRSGGETSESVQALASIIAAHLAGVLATTSAEADEGRAAASSS
jgi:hypothetical protein